MADVFVSYKAEDRRRVRPLVEALQAEGYSVWWDEQIGGGAAWRQTIENELNAAKCVLVAWSKRSTGPDGTFVQDEATRAQQRRVYIPVIIDKVHLPLGFGETQALSLVSWRGDCSDARYQAVRAAVEKLAGRRTGREAATRPEIDRRLVLAGGTAATVAILGAGAWAILKPKAAEAAGSIAVLPFANLSGDPKQAYFSDGIAEELRSALARLAGLKVVGRTSSEAVRNDDSETAAKKLGVANILTGSVRQSPATIRVSAQLIDGSDGLERWSQNYDRSPGDTIKIQTDIAENVAQALSIRLAGGQLASITVGGTENPDAQNLLFQAQAAARRGDRSALKDGIALASAAIAADPNYADAHAFKALFTIYYASTFAKDVTELLQMRADAARTAQTALRLAPNSSAAHRVLAEIHRVALEVGPAIREYRRAIELAPGSPWPIADYSYVVANIGEPAEGIRMADQAIRLDPLNNNSYFAKYQALFAAHRFDEVVAFSRGLERTKPYLFTWPEGVASALIVQNKFAEAEPYLGAAPPDSYNAMVARSVILARTGRAKEIAPIVAKLFQIYGETASFQYAQIYAEAGDKDRAFAALDRAWQIRDSGLVRIRRDPFIDPLRSDPRYSALLKTMNFPS